MLAQLLLSNTAALSPLGGMRAAVVGGGPAGLLLAHRLLGDGATVDIFESRVDPRVDGAPPEGRAYALGLGLRGRTAIRSVDEQLWQVVAQQGFGSDRFTLHLPFGAFDLRKPDETRPDQEPSVLIYQTDLCSALLSELEARYGETGRLSVTHGTRVASIDVAAGSIGVAGVSGEELQQAHVAYDLVAGCDGVQSAVRAAMEAAAPSLGVETATLPGSLKVLRLPRMPAALAPDAVHLVPGKGGLVAFLEPTAHGVCALISWRGPVAVDSIADAGAGPEGDQATVDPAALRDAAEAQAMLVEAFPTLRDVLEQANDEAAGTAGAQFVAQRVSTASTVRCASYHLAPHCVLLGDAAHSTGGASGQGCNSALQDAVVLADALVAESSASTSDGDGGDGRCRVDVPAALAAYSAARVPEGHALLDLSVGPRRERGPLARLRFGLSSVTDSLLSKLGLGEPPLQTLLTTSLKPFAQIRREREGIFGPFPTDAEFAHAIEKAVGRVGK